MTDKNSLSERLQYFIEQKGLKSQDLARTGNIKKQTVSDYLSGKTSPSTKALKGWVQNYGLNLNWLITGEGEPENSQASMAIRNIRPNAVPEPAPQVCPTCNSNFAGHIVDVHSTIGAGSPSEYWEPNPLFQVCIPERFYSQNLMVIKVEGTSMEPLIKKGAYVGLDTGHNGVVAGEIYGVRVPYEGLTLKRVFVDPEKECLRLQSENPKHPEQNLPIEGREDLIVGKAVWVMQEI